MALRVWLPLLGNFKNHGAANIPAISLVSGNSWASSGKIGSQSLQITKQQSILGTSSCMTGKKQMSYAFWVKVNTAWSAQWLDGIAWYSTDGSNAAYSRQEFYTNCTRVGTWFSGSSLSGYVFTPGEWTHLAGTFDYTAGVAKFYINGVLQGTSTALSKTHSCRGDFYIGDSGIDIVENDVRIYDHCLSQAEIKELVRGLILHYPLNDTSLDSKPNLVPPNYWTGSKSLSLSANTTSYSFMNYPTMNVQPNKTYYWTVDVRVTSGAANLTSLGIDTNCIAGGYSGNDSAHTVITVVNPNLTKIKAGEWQTAYCITTVKADATNPQILHCLYGASSTATTVQVEYRNLMLVEASSVVPLRFWQGDIGYDCSGYCNNGVKIGTLTCDFDTPKYNMSTKIAAASSGIKIPNFSIDNIWSLSLWFKYPSQDSTGWKALVILNNNGGDADLQLGNFINCSGNQIQYSANGKYTTGVSFTYGEWHHIVNTYDGTTLKCYLDGVYKTSVTPGQTLLRTNLGIGCRAAATDFSSISYSATNAYISDVRIYATALSADDVKSLYQNEAYIDSSGTIYGQIR